MSLRQILLASFVPLDKVEWFYGYMEGKHEIKRRDIFQYRLVDGSLVILTFKFVVNTEKNVNFRKLFPNAVLINKKGDALYTINGLNALIDSENSDTMGNLNHSEVKVDWTKYQNRIIMMDGEKLVVNEIERKF
jgi:hypothetical protein